VSDLIYQRPAILNDVKPGRHAVIEASAGTGKTYVIEHLFADLVLSGRCDPEQALIVTFTEKATGELRARVRATLETILRGDSGGPKPGHQPVVLDAGARERLYAALNSFERAPVFTIHGFCQRVLAEFAFLTGTGFALDVVESRGAFHRGATTWPKTRNRSRCCRSGSVRAKTKRTARPANSNSFSTRRITAAISTANLLRGWKTRRIFFPASMPS
jgi:hypothetical protein